MGINLFYRVLAGKYAEAPDSLKTKRAFC